MESPHSIYTITTIGIHKLPNKPALSRTWGYQLTLSEAIADMHGQVDTEAGYYTHVVIERFTPGIYALANQETWFKWDRKSVKWKACSKPVSQRQIVNYGMG